MSTIFDRLWEQVMPKAMHPRTRRRARDLATGLLNCAGKRTITGLLCGSGRQFTDWSAADRKHTFDVKIITPVKWRPAGGDQTLQQIIIHPLGYRLSRTSKILYRQPAYLICNDLEQSIETILQPICGDGKLR